MTDTIGRWDDLVRLRKWWMLSLCWQVRLEKQRKGRGAKGRVPLCHPCFWAHAVFWITYLWVCWSSHWEHLAWTTVPTRSVSMIILEEEFTCLLNDRLGTRWGSGAQTWGSREWPTPPGPGSQTTPEAKPAEVRALETWRGVLGSVGGNWGAAWGHPAHPIFTRKYSSHCHHPGLPHCLGCVMLFYRILFASTLRTDRSLSQDGLKLP